MERIEAIIFDLGNVLVFHDNAALFRRLGEAAGLCGEGVEKLLPPHLWKEIHRGLTEEEIQREVCAALGIELTREAFCELWNCHFQTNQAILPHVESLLGRVKLAALSNTNPVHARYLCELLPVLGKFDRLVFSHEVKLMKPDPRIYQEAIRLIGAEPRATAFFDDIAENVEPALALGIRAYVFRSVPEFLARLSEMGLRPNVDGDPQARDSSA